MGTICNQDHRPRREIDINFVRIFADSIQEVADAQGISFDQALKVYEVAAYERRTDIMVDGGNFTDENMCGIGTAIKELGEQISDIADALQEIATKDM